MFFDFFKIWNAALWYISKLKWVLNLFREIGITWNKMRFLGNGRSFYLYYIWSHVVCCWCKKSSIPQSFKRILRKCHIFYTWQCYQLQQSFNFLIPVYSFKKNVELNFWTYFLHLTVLLDKTVLNFLIPVYSLKKMQN